MKEFLNPTEFVGLSLLEGNTTAGRAHHLELFSRCGVKFRRHPGSVLVATFTAKREEFLRRQGPLKRPQEGERLFIDRLLMATYGTDTGLFNSPDIAIFHEIFGHFLAPGNDEAAAAAASDDYARRVYGGVGRQIP
jgi:hypothetical protein